MLRNGCLCDYFLFVGFFCKGYFCYLFERQLYIIPPRKKGHLTTALDTKKSTQRNLVLGVKAGYDFIFGTLWYFITKCD